MNRAYTGISSVEKYSSDGLRDKGEQSGAYFFETDVSAQVRVGGSAHARRVDGSCLRRCGSGACGPHRRIPDEANGVALQNPAGLAVNSSGHLWVSEAASGGTVDKYSSSGAYQRPRPPRRPGEPPRTSKASRSTASPAKSFASDSNADDLWGIDPATAASTSTDLKSGLGSGCCYIRVAADNSGAANNGDLYVFSVNGTVVRVDSSGAPRSTNAGSSAGTNELTGADTPATAFGATGPLSGGGIAVDGAGRLWVADGANGALDEFEPSGEYLRTITEAAHGEPLGAIDAVAIDPTTGNVLVLDPTNSRVNEFTPTGGFVEATSASFSAPQGLAVGSTGKLYVADGGANNVVDVFSPPARRHPNRP